MNVFGLMTPEEWGLEGKNPVYPRLSPVVLGGTSFVARIEQETKKKIFDRK